MSDTPVPVTDDPTAYASTLDISFDVRGGLLMRQVHHWAALLAGGGNDVVATRLHLSINSVTWAIRVAALLVPVAVFVVTRRICLGLQLRDRERVSHGRETGVIKRLPHGGYVEVQTPLSRAELHTLTAHERPGELVERER